MKQSQTGLNTNNCVTDTKKVKCVFDSDTFCQKAQLVEYEATNIKVMGSMLGLSSYIHCVKKCHLTLFKGSAQSLEKKTVSTCYCSPETCLG